MSQANEIGVIRRGPYPELTPHAVVIGFFIGSLLAVCISYAALILGFSIEGSELAAILGFAILRNRLVNRNSIVENNVVQTIASAVNGASSGMMFTVPALFILDHTEFNTTLMVFGCIAGAFLGIAFIIPLRKQMIDYERLTYPSGVAVATILKSPGAGMQKAQLLIGAALLSGLVHFIAMYYNTTNYNLGGLLGMPEYMNGIWYISLLTIGIGFIAGRGGIAFVIGGFTCYWLIAPLLSIFDLLPTAENAEGIMTVISNPEILRQEQFRPVGIGMLIGGAITGIIITLPLIFTAIKSMQNANKLKSVASRDEMPIKLLYIAIVCSAIVLAIIAISSAQQVSIGRGLLMAVLGTLWIWIAGVILSEAIGRTNWSPLSGMTLIAITILVFITSDLGDSTSIIASITVGAAACVAMSQATDLMLDLKTGYLVGATPKMQQMGQFMGAWLGPILVMGLIVILHEAYVIGSDKLPAPQAQALATVIEGILGNDIPIEKYLAGVGLGALLSATGGGLGITVGLGFYLPFNIVLTYTIGTILRLVIDKFKGLEFSESKAIPVAAGLIIGEALVGVGFAIYQVAKAGGA